jgi:hypothetical protein
MYVGEYIYVHVGVVESSQARFEIFLAFLFSEKLVLLCNIGKADFGTFCAATRDFMRNFEKLSRRGHFLDLNATTL